MLSKEIVEKVLGTFLERNKNYVIHAYIRKLSSENILAEFSISDRRTKEHDDYYKVIWDEDYVVISYADAVNCYEEIDEFGQQSVHIFLGGGIRIEFECCGEQILK